MISLIIGIVFSAMGGFLLFFAIKDAFNEEEASFSFFASSCLIIIGLVFAIAFPIMGYTPVYHEIDRNVLVSIVETNPDAEALRFVTKYNKEEEFNNFFYRFSLKSEEEMNLIDIDYYFTK